jgi:uncharacterized protein YjbI with pentapeptide repeats
VRGGKFTLATSRGFTAAQLYSTASYQAHDLAGIVLLGNNLSGWNFAGQNLKNADIASTTLTGADFTGAEIRGARFWSYQGTGLTLAQLYSTASYQVKDLTGVNLGYNDLTGANFAGFNLTNATFFGGLTDADFSGADVRGARLSGLAADQLYSTASYQAHDLTGVRLDQTQLDGWNFAGQNLTNANFYYSSLVGTNFTGAEIRGANFEGATNYLGSRRNGFIAEQLYSTASYQARDLTGIRLASASLAGWNFAGVKLTNARFSRASLRGTDFSDADLANADFGGATLTNANLRHANLANANFGDGGGTYGRADVTGADVTGADTRGAISLGLPTSTITTNLILPNGHINGLDLDAGGMLVVRDYDGKPTSSSSGLNGTIPITVDQQFAMGAGGILRTVFEADAWDSTISFAPGIPVTLGGTLDLVFSDGTNLASQVGRTFDLFDWTGVAPTGAFFVESPYAWNLSNLYTSGEVTLTAVPEPPALVLSTLALFGLIQHRPRRKSSASWINNHFNYQQRASIRDPVNR